MMSMSSVRSGTIGVENDEAQSLEDLRNCSSMTRFPWRLTAAGSDAAARASMSAASAV